MTRLPDFLIIGAQKSGSTWLAQNIARHPEIYMPSPELHFFNLEQNYTKGIKWYATHFTEAKNGQIIGEKTPNYLWLTEEKIVSKFGTHLPNSHQRIFNILPQAKLIVVLRNPVNRAISAINHYRKNGQIPASVTIDDLLFGNKQHLAHQFGIISMGFYYQQLRAYCDRFDAAQLCTLIYEEDIVKQPIAGLKAVCQFLGIDSTFQFKQAQEKVHVYQERPYLFTYLHHHFPTIYPHLQKLKPLISNRIRAKITTNTIQKATPSPRALAYLSELYAEENSKLFQLLKRDIPSWHMQKELS